MFLSSIKIENFRSFGQGEKKFDLDLRSGLTALVGENDAGKTAVVDAIRLALGTADQESYRIEPTDFCESSTERIIRIVCRFDGLNAADKRVFLEYLTHSSDGTGEPVLFLHWTAQDLGPARGRRQGIRTEARSGAEGNGPAFSNEVREFLQATYLRPLRDAERALSSGRGSRLAQVLQYTEDIKSAGIAFDPNSTTVPEELNVLGIGDYANFLLKGQAGVVGTREKIDGHLSRLSLRGESISSEVKVNGATASDDVRLRQLLEKLELGLGGPGKLGLGSNNLLFMACELLLLAENEAGPKLLLIEEPEAHLHSQRQLRLMRSLQTQAAKEGIQIIVTTHSPNLASAINLENIVIIRNSKAFPLTHELTQLDKSDYSFLERFLDATKANLFFARGLMIVEGDAENILIPTLAELLGRDFTENGVSIVNVKGTGLSRYARILLRKDPANPLNLPVACVTDMDVMPDIAPEILGKLKTGDPWPSLSRRKWRAKRDIGDDTALGAHRQAKLDKAAGPAVRSFVSTEWTLEYDLALGRKGADGQYDLALAEDVFISAALASADDAVNAGKKDSADIVATARSEFQALSKATPHGPARAETIACEVYARFTRDEVSKPIAAQYLAARLKDAFDRQEITAQELREKLPTYLVEAIDHITHPAPPQPKAQADTAGKNVQP